MNTRLILSEAPHVTKIGNTTVALMRNVLIALLPTVFAAIYFFGFMVVVNIFCCILFCAGFELLYGMLEKKDFSSDSFKKSTVWNLSCVVTGVILALNLPAKVNIFGAENEALVIISTIFADFLGSLIAIVIAKMLFGGIGRNFVNPALVGRVFLIICFSKAMTTVSIADGVGLNAVTGATWLSTGNKVTGNLLLDMLFGNTSSAAVGETCSIAIFIGFLYLCITKTIDFRLPLAIITTVVVAAFLFEGVKLEGTDIIFNILAHVLSGGILFGAVFMATDYSTTPNTRLGMLIFGIGIGLITVLIRAKSTSYPEGTSFAILIMNLLVPILDKYILPKPFGTRRRK